MHNKFHTLLVDRLTDPLDDRQKQILLDTLDQIARFVGEQYRRYTQQEEDTTVQASVQQAR